MSPKARSSAIRSTSQSQTAFNSVPAMTMEDTYPTSYPSPMSNSSSLPPYQPPMSASPSPPGYYYSTAGYKNSLPSATPATAAAVPIYLSNGTKRPAKSNSSMAYSYSPSPAPSSSGSSKNLYPSTYSYPSPNGQSKYTGADSVMNAPYSAPLELSFDPMVPTLNPSLYRSPSPPSPSFRRR